MTTWVQELEGAAVAPDYQLGAAWRAIAEAVPLGEPVKGERPRPFVCFQSGNDDEKTILWGGSVALLAGAGGVGKSMLALELAIVAASGGGVWPRGSDWYTVAGRVLYLGAEDSAHEIHARALRICEARDLPPERVRDNLTLATLDTAGASSAHMVARIGGQWSETREALALTERANDYDLIILDPGSRFLGPEVELDASAATAGIGAIQKLSQRPRRALVIACVHTTKADRTAQSEDSTGVRGSSALTDGVRAVLKLDSPGRGVAVLKHVKGNNAGRAGSLDLAQVSGGLWVASTAENTARAQLRSMLGAELQKLDAWNAAEKIGTGPDGKGPRGAASEIGLPWPDVEKIKRLAAMLGDESAKTQTANLAEIPKPEGQNKRRAKPAAAAPAVPALDRSRR